MVNLSSSFLLNNTSPTVVQVQQPLLTDFATFQRGDNRRRCRLSAVLRVGGILAQMSVLPLLIIFLSSLVADARGTSLLPPRLSSTIQTKNDTRQASHVAPVEIALAETETETSSKNEMEMKTKSKKKGNIFNNLWRRLRGKKVCSEVRAEDLINLFKKLTEVEYFKVSDSNVEYALLGYRSYNGDTILADISAAHMKDGRVTIKPSFDWGNNEPTVLGELLMTCNDPKAKECHKLDDCDFPNDPKVPKLNDVFIKITEDPTAAENPIPGQSKVKISFVQILSTVSDVSEKP